MLILDRKFPKGNSGSKLTTVLIFCSTLSHMIGSNIFKDADSGSNFSKMTSFDKKIVEKVDFESILSEKSILGRKT